MITLFTFDLSDLFDDFKYIETIKKKIENLNLMQLCTNFVLVLTLFKIGHLTHLCTNFVLVLLVSYKAPV